MTSSATLTAPATATAAPPALAAESRAVLSHHARSFRWAAALLPGGRHDDAAIAYAFCRHIDDTADEAPDVRRAQQGLAYIAAQLHSDSPRDPLVAAYLEMAARRHIVPVAAEQLLEGARSDLQRVRVADDTALLRYCYRVAGTVGLMMCGVLGVRDPRALAHAVDLGIAMQLTNICRDVLEDAGRQRVYLPASRLRAAGVTRRALLAGAPPRGAVAAVVRDLLALADRYYASADDGMHFIPWRARFAIVAAARIYRAIGVRLLRQRAGDPLRGRVIVPWHHKLLWLLLSLFATLRLSISPRWRHRRPHHQALHAALAGLLPATLHVDKG